MTTDEKRIADIRARLEEIEARANAATEGPWHGGVDEDTASCSVFLWDSHPVYPQLPKNRMAEFYGDSAQPEIDADFIAHSRADIPDLIFLARAEKERADGLEREIAALEAKAAGSALPTSRTELHNIIRSEQERVAELRREIGDKDIAILKLEAEIAALRNQP